jgi:rubredoxin
MGWHIELQCDTRECQRLSDGVLGTSVKNVSAEARAKGWIQDLDGRWRCPVCAPAFTVPRI